MQDEPSPKVGRSGSRPARWPSKIWPGTVTNSRVGVDRVDEIIDEQDQHRRKRHVDRRLAGLGRFATGSFAPAAAIRARCGRCGRWFRSAGRRFAGWPEWRRRTGRNSRSAAARLASSRHALHRLAHLILAHDPLELGRDRLGALLGQNLHRLGQRKAGLHGARQRDHRVGQLVFDPQPPRFGHPPQQIPRPAAQQHGGQHGEDQTVDAEPEHRRTRSPGCSRPERSDIAAARASATCSRRSFSARSRSTKSSTCQSSRGRRATARPPHADHQARHKLLEHRDLQILVDETKTSSSRGRQSAAGLGGRHRPSPCAARLPAEVRLAAAVASAGAGSQARPPAARAIAGRRGIRCPAAASRPARR